MAAFAMGEFLVVMDDENRENEGDLIVAADGVTTEQMAWMIKHTRCVLSFSFGSVRLGWVGSCVRSGCGVLVNWTDSVSFSVNVGVAASRLFHVGDSHAEANHR